MFCGGETWWLGVFLRVWWVGDVVCVDFVCVCVLVVGGVVLVSGDSNTYRNY